ncbi:MAG: NADH-quinone oxidoreductase subunit C, partial [Planctomycetes bacterium]|nr:NADH-quinone oxidoreductase subunit C [Planctomycetota bacterium]
MTVLDCGASRVAQVLGVLREAPDLAFDTLTDLAGVDYLDYGPLADGRPCPARFAVVYHLRSLAGGERLRVRAWVDETDASCPTVSATWPAAGWLEREVYDLFGVRFQGHPDLRRILTPEDYPGHPLRKDYPTSGRGERSRFPVYHLGGPPGRRSPDVPLGGDEDAPPVTPRHLGGPPGRRSPDVPLGGDEDAPP